MSTINARRQGISDGWAACQHIDENHEYKSWEIEPQGNRAMRDAFPGDVHAQAAYFAGWLVGMDRWESDFYADGTPHLGTDFTDDEFGAFFDQYVATLKWSAYDAESFPEVGELAYGQQDEIAADISDFLATYAALIHRALVIRPSYTLSGVAHDYALTRNRHGAGFWDSGLGDVGDLLTEAAHAAGSQSLYVGDDGLLYVEG